ncbi:MAG: hypothetical protein JNK10_11915 [Cyclobacteriaceae bacterium]|nr:hypothetical protein [Cyclobacteriaceae bacterium]
MIAQIPDIIFLNGEAMSLYSNPLEDYWTITNRKRPPLIPSPDCVRGYVATWEISDDRLLLRDIKGTIRKRNFLLQRVKAPYTLKKLFSGRTPVMATWYSGRLRVPAGQMIRFEDNGYDSRFEKEVIVTVEDGRVTRMVTLDNINRTVVSA